MTAAHYKGGHQPGNDLGLHYTALPPIVASCPYSNQLLVTRKFWSPGANRPSQVRRVAVLAGMMAGFVCASFSGVFSAADFAAIKAEPLLAIPRLGQWGIAFDPTLITPFVIAVLA